MASYKSHKFSPFLQFYSKQVGILPERCWTNCGNQEQVSAFLGIDSPPLLTRLHLVLLTTSFRYNEPPPTKKSINIIDNNVKKFGNYKHPSYIEQFSLHLFARTKRDPV